MNQPGAWSLKPGAWSPEPGAWSLDETARLRRAMASMAVTFEGVAAEIAARHDERCPYRSAQELCTFSGGCQNQRRDGHGDAATVACGGDERLCWAPPPDSLELGAWSLEPEAGSLEAGAGGLEPVP